MVNPANFDSTTSPCQDFDAYVNGGWLKRQEAPDEAKRSASPLLDDLFNRGAALPEQLLQEAWKATSVTADTATRILGEFYGSCMTDTTGTARGAVGDTIRAHYCLHETENELTGGVEEIYAKHVMTPAVRAKAVMVFDQLKRALGQQLRGASWLSERTKQQGTARIAAIQFLLGDGVTSDGVTKIKWPDYRGLVLSSTDFKGNLVAVEHAPPETQSQFNGWALWQPYASAHKHLINAFFLAPSYFDPTDAAVAYGSFGFVAGHEMGHLALDDDEDATEGWTPSEDVALQQRTQRILVPYLVAGVDRIYSVQNPQEHTADFIGLRVAYDAFEQVIRGQPQPRINGLTQEQRFFVAFASAMSYLYLSIHNHPLALLRTNLAVSSMPAFARAFGCKAGDAMVWPSSQPIELW